MTQSTLSRDRRLASTVYARTKRLKGEGHPDTVAARRAFGAAKLAETMALARDYGLDTLDILAVVDTGQLPATVAA